MNTIHTLIKNLTNKQYNPVFLLKEISTCIQYASECDLQLLITFVNTARDLELLTKSFHILSVCVANDCLYSEAIIACRGLYSKVNVLLTTGPLFNNTVLLNFLTVIVQSDERDDNYLMRNNLSQFAKNMIRISGCLRSMAMIFQNNMMYPNTWRALCYCLAECCRNSVINQRYCSHLIPTCIESAHRGDLKVLPLLHSLIYENEDNCNFLATCNGFQLLLSEWEEWVEQVEWLEVMGALLRPCGSAAAVRQVRASPLPARLARARRIHGPHSPIGSWCSIILYYIDVNVKYLQLAPDTRKPENVVNYMNCNTSKDTNNYYKHNNTSILYHNIMKEIMNYSNANEVIDSAAMADMNVLTNNVDKNPITQRDNINLKQNNTRLSYQMEAKNAKCTIERPYKNMSQCNFNNKARHVSALSNFRVQRDNTFIKQKNKLFCNPKVEKYSQTTLQKLFDEPIDKDPSSVKEVEIDSSFQEIDICYEIFAPVFTSTVSNAHEFNKLLEIPKQNNVKRVNSKREAKLSRTCMKKYDLKFRNTKIKLDEKKIKVAKNTSKYQGSWFLNAINESCANIVSIVKHIVMPNKNIETTKTKLVTQKYSSSFTNYMKKRDDFLNNKPNSHYQNAVLLNENHQHSSDYKNADFNLCVTCNDTGILKMKLKNNEFLKETVNKLKSGINIYGCDFKKLSRILWPNEAYMTPSVLYSLYRKLILK